MRRASRLPLVVLLGLTGVFVSASVFSFDDEPREAPAAFDGQTNGAVTQDVYDKAQVQFDDVEGLDEGLGPVYNAQSCRECHQSIVDGGASQVRELRAGHRDASGHFVGAVVPTILVHPPFSPPVTLHPPPSPQGRYNALHDHKPNAPLGSRPPAITP